MFEASIAIRRPFGVANEPKNAFGVVYGLVQGFVCYRLPKCLFGYLGYDYAACVDFRLMEFGFQFDFAPVGGVCGLSHLQKRQFIERCCCLGGEEYNEGDGLGIIIPEVYSGKIKVCEFRFGKPSEGQYGKIT